MSCNADASPDTLPPVPTVGEGAARSRAGGAGFARRLIDQIRRLWGQPRHGLARAMVTSFATVAGLTVAAKGVSFVKDAAVAQRFGAGDALDAYLLAFGFVSFAATVLGGGLPEAFLPLHAELLHRRGPRRAARLGAQCGAAHGGVLLLAALAVGLGAPRIVGFIGSGFSPEKRALAEHCMRALTPFLVAHSLMIYLATWLRAGKQFALATAAPALTPMAIFITLLLTSRRPTVEALCLGTDIGAALAVGVLGVALWRARPRDARWLPGCLRLWEPHAGRVMAHSVAFLLSGVIFSSSIVVDQTMAAWLAAGSVVVLSYSDKVCGLVLGLTAAPASDALFPFFAEAVAKRHWRGVRRQMLASAGTVLLFAIPMALALMALAPWIVRLLFQRGAFDAAAVERVAGVLRFSALQIPFFILGTLLSSIAVSLQGMRLMILLSIGATVANASLNWLLMQHLGLGGIALSTALVHLLSTATLLWWVWRALAQREREAQPLTP